MTVPRLQAGQALFGVTDQRITPVFLDDALTALRQIVQQRYRGTLHVAASTSTTTPSSTTTHLLRARGPQPGLGFAR